MIFKVDIKNNEIHQLLTNIKMCGYKFFKSKQQVQWLDTCKTNQFLQHIKRNNNSSVLSKL